MADFQRAFKTLMALEFNDPKNFLHKNKGEKDYTIGGVYRFAHPSWEGWQIVMDAIEYHNGDIATASENLYSHDTVQYLVAQFYKSQFWDRMKLDYISSQNTAEEIFCFAVNSGCRNAIRKAQALIGATPDGLIGPETIVKLNNFDEAQFDMQFDEVEKQYYADIIKRKPSFAVFENGWNNRANAV